MAFISEIHYQNSYNPDVPGNPEDSPTSTEFSEVALNGEEQTRPGDFTLSFYNAAGLFLTEVTLDTITPVQDSETGLYTYRVDQTMSDPDPRSGTAVAVALTENGTVLNYYDIGGGTRNITALNGAAAGAVSVNIPGSGAAKTIQFDNQGNRIDGPATPGRAICFAAGTLIATPDGEVPVETLRIGQLVLTRDRGPQEVRWLGLRRLSQADLRARPQLMPVRISAGSLAPNLPCRDLTVSPQHRILVRSSIAQRMFGTHEVLVAAKQLQAVEGIDTPQRDSVTYYHIALDRHDIIYANGVEAESLLPGREALKSVTAAARQELEQLFPAIASQDHPPSARPIAQGREARNLAARHAKNAKPLVAKIAR